jgi:hypothetical protein
MAIMPTAIKINRRTIKFKGDKLSISLFPFFLTSSIPKISISVTKYSSLSRYFVTMQKNLFIGALSI